MVKVENGFKEVKLKGRVVKFLLGLNTERRDDVAIDKAFIKALVISVFSVSTIKANGMLQSELVDFMRGEQQLLIFLKN